MSQTGLYARILAALLFAILPLLLGTVAAVVLDPPWLAGVSESTLVLLVVVAAVVWAGMLALPYSRSLLLELRAIVRVAERGRYGDSPPDTGRVGEGVAGEHERLAGALDERNRQMAELAARVRSTRITEDATSVATHVVAAARSVTGDPTWTLAILDDGLPEVLPPGAYGPADDDRTQLDDLHRWAAVAGEPGNAQLARRVEGPWGAFMTVHVGVDERLRALLLAPWEGRPEPSPAELTLLTLLGEYAATALNHALLYAQLRRQTDELDRMAAVQRDFLRGVSHDLQTPLTSIGGLAAELRAGADLGPEAGQDLEMIEHQADRLRRMVGQLLVVSRLEAGAIQPRLEIFRPEPLIRRTWDALRRPQRRLVLRTAAEDYLAVGDPDRFEQVLWAVLDNAVKYGLPASPVEIDITARDGSAGSDPEVRVIISDQGIGMDAETLSRAMHQFYRSPEARNLVPDGSGIGLYAARGLVEAMGGSLHLESRQGEGTTVTITLPAEHATAEANSSAPAATARVR